MLNSEEDINYNGYRKINFGDNFETLQLLYPDVIEDEIYKKNAEDFKKTHNTSYNEKRRFSLNYDNIFRYFYFRNNKLVNVEVIYNNLCILKAEALFNKLTKYFGKFDRIGYVELDNEFLGITFYVNIVSDKLKIIIKIWDIKDFYGKCTHRTIKCHYNDRNAFELSLFSYYEYMDIETLKNTLSINMVEEYDKIEI